MNSPPRKPCCGLGERELCRFVFDNLSFNNIASQITWAAVTTLSLCSMYLLAHFDSVKALDTFTSDSGTVNNDIRQPTIKISSSRLLRKQSPAYPEGPLSVHASIYFSAPVCCTALEIPTWFIQGERSPPYSTFILCQLVYCVLSFEF